MLAVERIGPPLPLALELPVLGLPVRFEADAQVVLDTVEEAFGAWRGVAVDTAATGRFTVRVAAAETPHGALGGRTASARCTGVSPRPGGRIRHLTPDGSRLVVVSPEVIGCSDPRRRSAFARITATLLEDRPRFREEVLEALTLGLLTRFDRQPLHAAALVREGRAVLLAGPSGSGKSTLAFAAARAGMDVLSEDTVFLQGSPHIRVWGTARGFRLLVDDTHGLIPSGLPARRRRPGDPLKLHVPLSDLGTPVGPRAADRCVLCVLGQRREAAALRRITAAEAFAALDLRAGGFDLFARSIRPVLARILESGAWLLHPERSPWAGVRLLERILEDDTDSGRTPEPFNGRSES